MSVRYFEVHALGLNVGDTRYDKSGAGYSFSSLVRAKGKTEAENEFRKDPRFRRTVGQNGEDWRTVPIVVSECPASAFGADIAKAKPVSYRRAAFLKRVNA